MSPPWTVATPSSTIHFPPSHCDKSLPSKSTIASDGGLLFSPGVTTFGSGQFLPLLYSAPTMWATKATQRTIDIDGNTNRLRRDMSEDLQREGARAGTRTS